ncbi:hypothetical protein HHK36_028456 [Tetracentron sinense]|uniref:Uncharacterized protein n=1 Tax=Tetracentron sinense TaxID=13715 RepID=A0A834YGD9_TETSI|nr:hypothetical protein HHK36_028456 [Tetracentron sinense]
MLGDCCLFPCFQGQKSETVDGNSYLDPVLLVSGIGGSILHSKDKRFGFQTRVWVQIFLANLEFKKKLWPIYNPKTGYTKSLDDNTEIVVPDDDYGLYAIDILHPSLTSIIYKKGTMLFGYGYDFRQSNRIEKYIGWSESKIGCCIQGFWGRKVNIISHSMGELLMLCFLSLYPDVFAQYVNKWICIVCPFQGNSFILCFSKVIPPNGTFYYKFVDGYEFVEGFESYFFVSRWTMHQLLVECPSIYEMLPNPQFKWKKQPQIRVWQKESEGKETSSVKLESYGPTESVVLFEEALRSNEIRDGTEDIPQMNGEFILNKQMNFITLNCCIDFYDKKAIGLPFNFSILRWAAGTRQILNNAQLPNGVSFYNIFGTSFDMPIDVRHPPILGERNVVSLNGLMVRLVKQKQGETATECWKKGGKMIVLLRMCFFLATGSAEKWRWMTEKIFAKMSERRPSSEGFSDVRIDASLELRNHDGVTTTEHPLDAG